MTLRAVLAAQGNIKGQGMARRPMPCLFNFPVLARAAFAGLFANWEYRGRYRFPHPTYKALLAINFASRAFFRVSYPGGKMVLPLYSQYFGLGL